jgi:SAM-dependent methyltransferase
VPSPSAADSYDWWAEAYDQCNAENDHELWLGSILLPELEKHGLRKGWALDVGCGTGLAFAPLLERGWRVVGCDASTGMLAAAEQKFGPAVRLLHLDARTLPPISPNPGRSDGQAFDLVLMLNDVINYLTDRDDLERAFAGIKRNLTAAGGLAVLDANSTALFQRDYGSKDWEQLGATDWRWRGITGPAARGTIYEAELEDPTGLVRIHRQRHWSQGEIEEACVSSGLRCVAVLGQREVSGEILLLDAPSDSEDEKAVYLLTHESA